MKAKHLSLALAAVLAAGGWWLARSAWHTPALQKTSMGAGPKAPQSPHSDPNGAAASSRGSETGPVPGPNHHSESGQSLPPPPRLAPPEPARRFTDFTPEQRVQFARQGHGPGG